MTYEQIKNNVRANLNDAGVTYWSEPDVRNSIEDCEAEVSFLARHIIKRTTLPFIATPYYDFVALGVEDFLAVIAIFNTNTNRWLRDDITVRDFDTIRDDWELWTGSPQHWAPVNFTYSAIVPYMPEPTGDLILYYASKPDLLTDYSLSPLIATDQQKLVEFYVTADLLEQAEEYNKAGSYWSQYFEGLLDYMDRVKNAARRDLLLKI